MARPYDLPPPEILNLIDFWTIYLDKHELTTAPDYRVAVRSTLKALQTMAILLCKSKESWEAWHSLI